MKIIINDHRRIFAIQSEFSEMFPYLRIQFFAKPNKLGAAPSKKIMNHPSKTLGDCRVTHTKGILSVTPTMTIGDLEQTFRDIYGLSIQVLRKSGNEWIKTNSIYKWSLAEQNSQGEAMSNYTLEQEAITDFQEAE